MHSAVAHPLLGTIRDVSQGRVVRPDAGAIVIAGTEHVRNDIGVPLYLASRVPGQRSVSIGFIEVEPGEFAVSDYIPPPATALPYDYAWLTTAAQRDDPWAGQVMPNRQ